MTAMCYHIHISGNRLSAPVEKKPPPIIGATCAFDAKIYKIVDDIFAITPYRSSNKKFSKLFYFYFQLPSLLVENSAQLKTQHSKPKTNIAIAFGRKSANILPSLTRF